MVFSTFQHHDLLLLFPSLGCIAISIWFYLSGRYPLALAFLAVGALGLRVFTAHLDPYLWDWDERYHAMVAKNLLLHPLKPTLYDNPVLPYDFTNWTSNHIWVHKQPLALWQMALSFFLFGVSPFTARIPMAIEGALMVLIIYRSGVLAINKNAGYLAALLYSVSFYALNFTSGGEATDHVDYALVFYVSASLWAYLEYRQKFKWKLAVAVGVFAGLAVLSKWTIGLLVFPAWGITVLADKEARAKLKPYMAIALAFIISVIIFLPWQLYCLAHYHTETVFEMKYNQSHLLKEVDGRGETPWYYLEQLSHNYGPYVPYIIGFAVLFLWRYIKNRQARVFIFSSLVIPYFLFSVIAATKMPAYCYIACVPVMLALGSLAWYLQQCQMNRNWGGSKWFVAIALFAIAYVSANFNGLAKRHTGYDPENTYRINKVKFSEHFLKKEPPFPKGYVVFGAPQGWEVEMMFYSGNTCYARIPDLEKYQELKAKGIKMAVIKSDHTPGYLVNDKDVVKVEGMF
jgi:4-amino-4-deoxy-L-arabinose transferase-like glycosyltransferase